MNTALFSVGGDAGRMAISRQLQPRLGRVPKRLNSAQGRPAAVLVGLQWRDADDGPRKDGASNDGPRNGGLDDGPRKGGASNAGPRKDGPPDDGAPTAGWHVIMTERASHLAHHAGQISFPGGKVDDNDADLHMTALREAAEEIDLAAKDVTIIGGLDPVRSPVGFVVQPVVAFVETGVSFSAEPNEVATILHLPLAHVLDPMKHRRDSYLRNGETRDFWVIDHPRHYLWGLSATILVDLAARLHSREHR